jgi:hypothetical protein
MYRLNVKISVFKLDSASSALQMGNSGMFTLRIRLHQENMRDGLLLLGGGEVADLHGFPALPRLPETVSARMCPSYSREWQNPLRTV